jgi:hypothetical protein
MLEKLYLNWLGQVNTGARTVSLPGVPAPEVVVQDGPHRILGTSVMPSTPFAWGRPPSEPAPIAATPSSLDPLTMLPAPGPFRTTAS